MKSKPLFETVLVSTLILNAVGAIGASSMSTDMSEAVEVTRKKHDLPGLAVVVVKDGQICDRAAVGVRKFGELTAVTTNDVFHIGSCTKPMTATLAAMLIEEGKLHYDSTIAELFPELTGRIDKQYGAVTVVLGSIVYFCRPVCLGHALLTRALRRGAYRPPFLGVNGFESDEGEPPLSVAPCRRSHGTVTIR